jgi:hypothetical protein
VSDLLIKPYVRGMRETVRPSDAFPGIANIEQITVERR